MRLAAPWLMAVALAFCSAAFADDLTAEKRSDIRQLIGLTAGPSLAEQVAQISGRSVATTFKQSRPDVPERVVSIVNRELATFFAERVDTPGGLTDRLVALYHKHFTHPEIRDLLAFNQTPTGRKALQVLPMISSESLGEGQAWGQSLAPEVRQRINAILKREGVPPRARR